MATTKLQKKSPREKQYNRTVTTHVKEEWVREAQYHPDSYSGFVRDAIIAYKNNRHISKFREILETIAGELLILTAWKEKGHPRGCKWTDKEDQQLEYYERCFDILMNSPFAEKLD
jgi:meiotically up-regulated gene 157 (Mug157) protein